MSGRGGAIRGILLRDALIFASYRWRPLTQALNTFLSLALFFFISKLVAPERIGVGNEAGYFAFAIVGVAFLPVLTAAVSTVPATVRGELMTGTFERLVVTPLGPVWAVLAMAIFPVAQAVITACLTVVLGSLVFGLDLAWETAWLAIGVAALASFAFLPFALLAVALVLFAKRAGAGTAYVVTAMSLTSGAFFPVSLLPWWLRWISEVQPLTPTLELLRRVLLGTPLTEPAWADVLRLVAFGAVLTPIGLVVLSATVRIGRRRGTLTEY